ncbi:PAS domain S-box protein [Montanilutibacter psychrotolerans]|uniref:PAS domain S-box protein n=1 Tax=Montanilutibacter psychrotolerans TaxID=1327343 RepID=A0A3M8SPN3_9GAMM|nr:PAS domain S-box protein [Lysobacter psychrotolerans]RNF83308.1 PAS domain S-box protein [Lysobacter psychrotolerans]
MSDTRNVLLVEDDSIDAALIEAYLSKSALVRGPTFHVERVTRFSAAVELLSKRDRSYDVLLLDRGLPDASRSSAIGTLRERFPALPIVVLTGLDDATAAMDAVANGAQDYLIKGRVTAESLARVLNYAITRQRLEQQVREREAENRALFDQNPVPIWVYDVETLQILEVNEAAQRNYGWTREEFLAMRVSDIATEQTATEEGTAEDADLDGVIQRHRTRFGHEILTDVSLHTMDFRGRKACLVLALDVTETQRMVEALSANEQRYRELFEMSLGLICEHTLDGRVLAINPAAAHALGYEPAELIGVSLTELVPERFRDQVDLYLEAVAREGRFTGMMTVQRRDGQWRAWRFHNRLYADSGVAPLVIGHAQDITDEMRHQQELQDASLTDPLTGARNRRYLDYLTRGGALSNWGCLVVDLDHFKQINDTFGHERGDEVLVGVVEFLRSQTRQDDVVVRMGGDEFMVLLCNEAADTVSALAQRVIEAMTRGEPPCVLSLGWATRTDDETLERTMARADQQLYDQRRRRRGERVDVH